VNRRRRSRPGLTFRRLRGGDVLRAGREVDHRRE
jgi:hypothetical protein